MAGWGLLLFAFAFGLALSGTVTAALGAAVNARAGLHWPFVVRERLARSLAVTAIAGPFMLANDAYSAWISGRLGPSGLMACLMIAGMWALALGVLATELAWRCGILIT